VMTTAALLLLAAFGLSVIAIIVSFTRVRHVSVVDEINVFCTTQSVCCLPRKQVGRVRETFGITVPSPCRASKLWSDQ
jgi:hypothetical protein